MITTPLLLNLSSFIFICGSFSGESLKPVPFTDVQIEDSFWSDRIETNRRVTIPYDFQKCEETGRISNFAKAAGLIPGEFEGIYYNDSDVYKVIEGAAYSLAARPDPELEAYLDDLIAKIAAAQQPDGYLNTWHVLEAPDKKWSNIKDKHELYCAGHLFEAAVEHYRATGKRTLLDVAMKLADHIDQTFGPGTGQNMHPPGHEEIEIGLVKLYHITDDRRYLDLAQFFIDQRGNAEGHALYGRYAQDHAPVTEQDEPVGHAVRAMYLYAGMADVAALTGNRTYLEALDRIWENQVSAKMYLTGGIGSTSHGEAFGENYQLPNESAYNETCAAIGNALWNHRMNLLHADAKYADVLERVIYNGFLSGVSLSGDRFFYPNPLASAGSYHRSPWFDCSCCPVNVVRFIPSIPGYIYATNDDDLYVNLFAQSRSTITTAGGAVTLVQKTAYPWEGDVTIAVDPDEARHFTLFVRIPGWARSQPVPSDLYSYDDSISERESGYVVAVNDQPHTGRIDRGYLPIARVWSPGDTVTISFDMPVRVVRAHENVEADRGRFALERGPIVYCVEAVDSGGRVRNLWVDPEQSFAATYEGDLLDGVVTIGGEARTRHESEEGEIESEAIRFRAIPYYGWDHRAPGEMAVWLPDTPELAEIIPAPTLASRAMATSSFCYQGDAVEAVNDQREPQDSIDHSIPRLTFWPHKGTSEWVQLEFEAPARVSSTEIYWFDDTGRGQCRLPKSWRLLYRDSGTWKPVANPTDYGVKGDQYNRVEFDPVLTDALRIEIELQEGFSGGVLEWRAN